MKKKKKRKKERKKAFFPSSIMISIDENEDVAVLNIFQLFEWRIPIGIRLFSSASDQNNNQTDLSCSVNKKAKVSSVWKRWKFFDDCCDHVQRTNERTNGWMNEKRNKTLINNFTIIGSQNSIRHSSSLLHRLPVCISIHPISTKLSHSFLPLTTGSQPDWINN